MSVQKLECQCGSCKGAGVFRGMNEPKGFAVVCLDCDGAGKKTIEYTPFTERVRRDDVDRVGRSKNRGFRETRIDPTTAGIPYEAFFRGEMPPE